MRSFRRLKQTCTSLSLITLGCVYLVLFVKFPYPEEVSPMYSKTRAHLTELKLKHLHPYNSSLPSNYLIDWKNARKWKQALPKFIVQRLKNKRNGFFIECGAYDGLFFSNTLLLERSYNWTGLLVEADPDITTTLKRRNRKAWVADICLAPKPRRMNATMSRTNNKDVIAGDWKNKTTYTKKFQVQCYPLDMLLDAIEVTKVDFFSLDVEGMEVDILKTIPWDKYHIKLISVKVRPSNKAKVQKLLESVGYNKIKEMIVPSDMVHDDVYEKEEIDGEI